MRWNEVIREHLDEQTYIHGSRQVFKIGTVLRPSGQFPIDGDIEEIVESQRPPEMVGRDKGVYMAANAEDLEHFAREDGHIYDVRPLGPVHRHDHRWINEIWSMVARAENEELNDEELLVAQDYARSYWNGECCGRRWEAQWEYLTPSAEVVGV